MEIMCVYFKKKKLLLKSIKKKVENSQILPEIATHHIQACAPPPFLLHMYKYVHILKPKTKCDNAIYEIWNLSLFI